MSLLELPGEILVPILALAAEDDLGTLFNASLTCHLLHDLVEHDVWRQLHHLKYDDPSKACAFASPRAEYDWKQRVIDRDFAIDFVQQHGPPVPGSDDMYTEIDMLRDHELRVFNTILDMYYDLPALGAQPSRNAPILTTMGESPLVASLCGSDMFDDELVERHRVHSIFLTMNTEYSSFGAEGWFVYNRSPDDEELPSSDKTYWFGIKADSSFAFFMVDHMAAKAKRYLANANLALIRQALGGGLDAVRGSGILDLQRPLSLGDADLWDWAGIQGQWYTTLTHRRMSKWRPRGPLPEPTLQDPETFDVVPAASPTAILDAYRTTFGDADNHLWDDLSANVYDIALPPVYFHGTTQSTGPASKFIFGVAHLTRDEPPELRWDLGIVDRATPSASVVYQGVQVGGPGAKRGVFGQYKFWKRSCNKVAPDGQSAGENGVNGDDCPNGHGDDPIPRPVVLPTVTGDVDEDDGAVDFRTRTDGMGWLFKIGAQYPPTDCPSGATEE